jgi:hypothetical protein
MRPFVLAPAFFAYSLMSFAQQPYAIKQGIQHTDKGWMYKVQNTSAIPIVAFHWITRCASSLGYDLGLDTLIAGAPIRAGETYSAPVADNLINCPSSVAFIYADGQTFGDADQLANIRDVRRGIYRALLIAKPTIERVAAGQSTIAAESKQLDLQKTQALQDFRNGLLNPAIYKGELIGFNISFGLVKEVDFYPIPTDSNDKFTSSLEELIASGLPRERAEATIARQPIQKWMKTLEDNGAAQ